MSMRTEKDRIKWKKTVIVFFAISSLLSMPLLSEFRTLGMADPRVIYVSNQFPADFSSIQNAINNASAGDTIFVYNGTYTEDIFLNKSVSLVGENRDLTVINNVNQLFVVSITANDASLCNFTVSNIAPSLGSGILISSAHNVTVCNNSVRDNLNGMLISASFGDSILGNIIFHNTFGSGIYVDTTHNNLFSDNNISQNNIGLDLVSSSNDNIVRGNTISNNSNYGVSLTGSSGNVFYHNNFVGQSQIASDSGNTWDYGGEGNYWSAYKAFDLDSDGIGDAPYVIGPNNVDFYPLMGQFRDFSIPFGNVNYNVYVVSNSTVDGLTYETGQETGNGIIRFGVTDGNGTGFSRLMIPTTLMKTPYIVLDGDGEIAYVLLNAANETNTYAYITYPGSNQTITMISSKALQLYQQLSQELSANQTALLAYLGLLNSTNANLLINYANVLDLLNQLQNNYSTLNTSYQQQLSTYSQTVQNLQNLIYIFAATTIMFLITTVYLSRRGHASSKQT